MSNTKKRRKRKIILGLILLVIAARIYLPYWVTDHVNKVLDEIPGHRGQITDVDIWLIRGAYVIDSLKVENIEGKEPVTFVDIPRIDLSVEWKELFNGAIVGEIVMDQPELMLTVTEYGEETYGEEVDWTEPLKELMPLRINRLELKNGHIVYQDLSADPQVEFDLRQLQATATNLSNSEGSKDSLPSSLELAAVSLGDGKVHLSGNLNALKQVPDMDIDLKFEHADLTAFNDALKAYMALDAEQGALSVYSEILLMNEQLDGYVKPLVEDLKVVKWSKDKKQPLQLMWESIAGVVLELFENQPHEQFATKVPMRGDLSDPKAKVFPTIVNVLKNAFFKAFEKDVDGTISLEGDTGKKGGGS